MSKQKELEQHFLNKSGQNKFKESIAAIEFDNFNIFELGSGTGKMSEIIFDKNPKSLTLFELDEELFNPIANKDSVDCYNDNIMDVNFNHYRSHILIAAPPYACLEFIAAQVKTERIFYILLVSETYLDLFNNYIKLGHLESTDFTPNSKKNRKHYLITNIKV